MLRHVPRLAPLAAVALLLPGCLDFGYDAAPPQPHDAGPRSRPDGCVEGPADPLGATVQIQYASMDVDQHLVRIASGDTIAWINGSSQTHTASAGAPGADLPAAAGGFDSGALLAGGGRWAYRFCDPRTIEWYCKTHPAQMNGYLIVIE